MAKLTLTDADSGFRSTSAYNANNALVEAEFQDKVLYRDNPVGEPNQMENDLDMNSNRILNLPTPLSAGEPATYGLVLSVASGAQYSGTIVEIQTASAAQTVFTLLTSTYTPGGNNLMVFVEPTGTTGADYYPPDRYTETSTSVVTLDTGLSAGDKIVFIMNANPIETAAISGITEESELAQAIFNNISLGSPTTYTADFTLDSSMAYQYIRVVAGAPVDITVPEDSSSNILVGTEITVRLASDVVCTVVESGSVTVNPPAGGTLGLGGEGATVTLKKVAANEWDLIGQVFAV